MHAHDGDKSEVSFDLFPDHDQPALDDPGVLAQLESDVPEDTVVLWPVEKSIPEAVDPAAGVIVGTLVGALAWILILGAAFIAWKAL